MTNARLIALMSGLTALGLAIVAVLLNAMSVNQSATVEQMLSSEDLAQLNAQRAAFGLESDPVLIAIDSPDAIPPARLIALELALREIPQVADTLSSAALGAGAGSPAMRFSLPAGSGLVVVFLRSGLSGLQAAQQVSAHIDKTVNAHITSQQTAAIVGLPQIRIASWQITRSDMVIVLPMLLLITMLVTLGFFRSYAAMLLALLLTSLTTALCLLFQFVLASQLSTGDTGDLGDRHTRCIPSVQPRSLAITAAASASCECRVRRDICSVPADHHHHYGLFSDAHPTGYLAADCEFGCMGCSWRLHRLFADLYVGKVAVVASPLR